MRRNRTGQVRAFQLDGLELQLPRGNRPCQKTTAEGQTKMNEERAFIDAIHANRRDTTTRLVYADWLYDQDRVADSILQRILADPRRSETGLNLRAQYADAVGGTRGAFIHAAIRLARVGLSMNNLRNYNPCGEVVFVPDGPPVNISDSMAEYEHHLHEHEHEWLAGSPLVQGEQMNSTWVPFWEWQWEFGFIDYVQAPSGRFVSNSTALFDLYPITRVELLTQPPLKWAEDGPDGRLYAKIPKLGSVLTVDRKFANCARYATEWGVCERLLMNEFPSTRFALSATAPRIPINVGRLTKRQIDPELQKQVSRRGRPLIDVLKSD